MKRLITILMLSLAFCLPGCGKSNPVPPPVQAQPAAPVAQQPGSVSSGNASNPQQPGAAQPAEPQSNIQRPTVPSHPDPNHPSEIVSYVPSPSRANMPGAYPDSSLTPGAVFSNETLQQLQTPGQAHRMRHVTRAEKRLVFRRYGIPWKNRRLYEVDHLIPLTIGGSNDVENLWPQKYASTPDSLGAHDKDKVEFWLHEQIMQGAMTPQEAQRAIAEDWVAVFNKLPAEARREHHGHRHGHSHRRHRHSDYQGNN